MGQTRNITKILVPNPEVNRLHMGYTREEIILKISFKKWILDTD